MRSACQRAASEARSRSAGWSRASCKLELLSATGSITHMLSGLPGPFDRPPLVCSRPSSPIPAHDIAFSKLVSSVATRIKPGAPPIDCACQWMRLREIPGAARSCRVGSNPGTPTPLRCGCCGSPPDRASNNRTTTSVSGLAADRAGSGQKAGTSQVTDARRHPHHRDAIRPAYAEATVSPDERHEGPAPRAIELTGGL